MQLTLNFSHNIDDPEENVVESTDRGIPCFSGIDELDMAETNLKINSSASHSHPFKTP